MTAQADFANVLSQARSAGKQAVAMLAEQHLPLVAALVKRFPWNGREREELYQQGCVGLMKALARFDPDYGASFSTYAAAMILGEMRMLTRIDAPIHVPRRDRELHSRIRKTEKLLTATLGREPTINEMALALRMSTDDLVLAMDSVQVVSLDAQLQHSANLLDLMPAEEPGFDRLMMRDLIGRLPKEDQRLVLLRYRYGKTQTETARIMGITQVQVSRREFAIKAELRKNWNPE